MFGSAVCALFDQIIYVKRSLRETRVLSGTEGLPEDMGKLLNKGARGVGEARPGRQATARSLTGK